MDNLFDLYKDRIIETFLPDISEDVDFLGLCRDDGSFSDIDYTSVSRAFWTPRNHLVRLLSLSALYHKQGLYKEKIEKSMEFWFYKKSYSENWWHTCLGTPQLLRMILILCPFLSESVKENVISYMKYAIETMHKMHSDNGGKWTGMNQLWFAENYVFLGIFTKDEAYLKTASEMIFDLIFVSDSTKEGIHEDFSFAQHGNQLYNHGYGAGFAAGAARWAYILCGTKYEMSKEDIELICKYYTLGNANMMRFDALDFSAKGREIVRCFEEKQEHNIIAYKKLIPLLSASVKNDELKDRLSKSLDFMERRRQNPYLENNTLYYTLDYAVHHRNRFYTSVRLASKDVLGGDICDGKRVNGENGLDAFGAYGVTVMMTDGGEYKNIFPILDWSAMPGTTTPEIGLEIEQGAVLDETFSAGVSDGKFGFISGDIKKTYTYNGKEDYFSSRKTYFMLDEGIVVLGSGLKSSGNYEYRTTLDQCNFSYAATDKCNSYTPDGIWKRAEGGFLYHNGKMYVNLTDSELLFKCEHIKKDYKPIYNELPEGEYFGEGDTLTVKTVHKKDNDTLAYAVFEGYSKDDAALLKDNLPFTVTENTASAHAILYKDIIFASFFEGGSVTASGCTLSADNACLILYDINSNAALISSPREENICVCINGIKKDVVFPSGNSRKNCIKL